MEEGTSAGQGSEAEEGAERRLNLKVTTKSTTINAFAYTTLTPATPSSPKYPQILQPETVLTIDPK